MAAPPRRLPCDRSGPSPPSPWALSPWPWRAARTDPTRHPAGHQPWLLSPALVATSYGAAELGLDQPVARRVGATAYEVGATGSEWVAKLDLAQPVRQGAAGVWVITRTASPAGSY
jgi:hypothetical protein